MYSFFIDKGNLKATAQLLFDSKRMVDAIDVDAVEAALVKRLKYEFSDSGEGFNMTICPCIFGPVYCMPFSKPNGPFTDIVLNLTIRPSDEIIPKWTFEPL
ncbi:hypothetical protein VRB78_13755 [Pseudomonas trivialis]|uniref:hypothetical protein n=1 Tax=Pseudomonas fluorescens group TaxID=136843 RepID=UPI000FE35489|nr:hypothetical protein [Pseudomonas veronii]RWA27984.1 hypothetical protein DJ028_08320 [Pseudomonas veronii]